MLKHAKAIIVSLIVGLSFSTFAQQSAQDDIQNQRIDELFRRYDSLTAGQNQLNQNVVALEQNMQQTVQRFDNSVNELSATVAQLAAILGQNRLVQNQVVQNQVVQNQARAFRTEALTSFDTTTGTISTAPTSFASPTAIFANPAIPNPGIEGNASATPGVIIEPQPVPGATLAPTPTQQPAPQVANPYVGASNIVVRPVAVYGTPNGVNTAPAGSTLPVITNGGTLAPVGQVVSGAISAVAPSQGTFANSGITHVTQATPAFGIQTVNGSSQSLPTGSFSPPAFPNTQSQLLNARYLQVGAYADYNLAANHAAQLRGLNYPVSERQEGIWLKLLIGPLPIEQINTIKGRLDAQGINSFVTQ